MSDTITDSLLGEGSSDEGRAVESKGEGCMKGKGRTIIGIIIGVLVILGLIAGIVCLVVFLGEDEGKSSSSEDVDVKIDPQDKTIEYIGRWDLRDPKKSYCGWPGSGIRVGVQGADGATIHFWHDHRVVTVRVWIDGLEYKYDSIDAENSNTIEVVFNNEETDKHVLEVRRVTEIQFYMSHFDGITLHNGKTLHPKEAGFKVKDHLFEFIGDSLTCGFGVLGPNSTCTELESEDVTRTYAWKIAEEFNAEKNFVSWSGIGVAKNGDCGDSEHTMPEVYPYLFGNKPVQYPFPVKDTLWDFKTLHPDAMFINLITNDYRCNKTNWTIFTEKYAKFMRYLLEEPYPDSTFPLFIFCGTVPVCQYVMEAVAMTNNSRIHYVPVISFFDERIQGCFSHPNVLANDFMFDSVVQRVVSGLNFTTNLHRVPRHEVGGVWGNDPTDSDPIDLCGTEMLTDEYTTLHISGLKSFPGTDERNYSLLEINNSLCSSNFSTKPELIHCPGLAQSFKTCRDHHVKILLSIGGPDCETCQYDLKSEEEARKLANELWDTYFGGNGTERPFDDAILSGINLDIQKGTELKYYATFVNTLVELHNASGSEHRFVVSVTTSSCEYPDPFVGPGEGTLLDSIHPDFVAVRFTTEECSLKHANYTNKLQPWLDFATNRTRVQLMINDDIYPQDPTKLKMYDIYQALENIRVSHQEHFGGVIFDSMTFPYYPSMYARTLNTMFKNWERGHHH